MENEPQNNKCCPKIKIAIANAALLLYFLLPNISSFLLVTLLIALYFSPHSNKCACTNQCTCSVNSLFNSYLELSHSKKLLVVLGAGLTAQLAYLLPTWLILLVGVEVWACWDFLVDFGVVELVQTQVISAQKSLKKLFDMIPRYQGE